MTENVGGKKPQLCRSKDVQTFGQRVLFTGPDGIGDYRAKLVDFPHYIGESPMAPGDTGDLSYLWRPAPDAPPPQPKHCYVGAVGWGLQHGWELNRNTIQSNMQIKMGEFRSALEERTIYSHHNPWQPPPSVVDQLPTGARGRFAWDHDINAEHFQNQLRQSQCKKNLPALSLGEDSSESSSTSLLKINQCSSKPSEAQKKT